MHVTYKPSGDVHQEWDFDPAKVRASQAEVIEKRYGQNWDKWRADVLAGSIKARRVLLWHLISLTHHTLKFEDTPDFLAGELLVEYSVIELRTVRERLEKANMDEHDREQMMTALDIEISEAMAREEAQGLAPEGKANSPLSAPVTG